MKIRTVLLEMAVEVQVVLDLELQDRQVKLEEIALQQRESNLCCSQKK
jgi:hypothetical protein